MSYAACVPRLSLRDIVRIREKIIREENKNKYSKNSHRDGKKQNKKNKVESPIFIYMDVDINK